MSSIKSKLYSVIDNVTIPSTAYRDPSSGDYFSQSKSIPNLVTITWPNGQPCIPAELFLQEKSLTLKNSHDGSSLKETASKLSHIIRYCWSKEVDLWNLQDNDFDDFISVLIEEKVQNKINTHKRTPNTVNRIIDVTIEFLEWLQHYFILDKQIVGIAEDNPNITLLRSTITDKRGVTRTKLTYPNAPPPNAFDTKKPMPRLIRNKLWDAIAEKSNPKNSSPEYLKQFKNNQEINIIFSYLKARRELLLSLCEASGARPGELADLKVSINIESIQSGKLSLSTLKRGNKRKIPIEKSITIKFELFIYIYRASLLELLRKRNINPQPSDYVFLTQDTGLPLSKASMTKDFQRIVQAANIEERSCLSMFRHRFITNMVKLHLREYMAKNNMSSRHIITDSDYRTILKKVATFTGHKDINSLFHYIDWAWDELGAFDYVEPAHELVSILEGSLNSFCSLEADVLLMKKTNPEKIIKYVTDELQSLRQRTLQAITINNSIKTRSD